MRQTAMTVQYSGNGEKAMEHTKKAANRKLFPHRSREWKMVVALAFVIVAILIFSFVVLAQQITSLTNASYHLAENQIDNVSNQVSYFYDNYKKMGTILSVSPNLVEYADYGKLEAEHSRPEAHTLSKETVSYTHLTLPTTSRV